MLSLVVGQVWRAEHHHLLELLHALTYEIFAQLNGGEFKIIEGGQDFYEEPLQNAWIQEVGGEADACKLGQLLLEIVPHQLVKNTHADVVEAFESQDFIEEVLHFEQFTVTADLHCPQFVQVFLNFNL